MLQMAFSSTADYAAVDEPTWSVDLKSWNKEETRLPMNGEYFDSIRGRIQECGIPTTGLD